MSDPIFRIVGPADPGLNVADRGLAYGHGLFESMRLVDHRLPLLDLHLDRLIADGLVIGIHPSEEMLRSEIAAFLPDCPNSGIIKVIVTAGTGFRGYRLDAGLKPTVVLQWFPPPSTIAEANLQLCTYRLPHNPVLAGIKHLNRLDQVMASFGLPAAFDGLLLDSQGNVIEALQSNIFVRHGFTWMTPSLQNCGIAGVMRRLLLQELLPVNGLSAVVGSISLPDIVSADAVFICNSVRGITPVRLLADSSGRILASWKHDIQTESVQRHLQERFPCFRT